MDPSIHDHLFMYMSALAPIMPPKYTPSLFMIHGSFECAPSALPLAVIKVAVWLLSGALSGALSVAPFVPLFGCPQTCCCVLFGVAV